MQQGTGQTMNFFRRILSAFRRPTIKNTEREIQEKKRALEAQLAAHPFFRDFKFLEKDGVCAGTMMWAGHEVSCEVTHDELDGIPKLEELYRRLMATDAEVEAAARAHILAAALDPNAHLSKWLEISPQQFVSDLVIEKICVTQLETYSLTYHTPMMGGLRFTVEGYVDEEITGLKLRGAGFKKGRMPLVLNGEALAIESAKFSIFVNTERWDEAANRWIYGPERLAVNYSLEIIVDEDSGEDGAPSPAAQSIPVSPLEDGCFPLPDALSGRRADGEVGWDCWYGNDAPPITANEITFGEWRDGRIGIRWVGQYGFRTKEPFLFDGEAAIEHIEIRVKEEAHADAFMAALFGEARVRALRREVGEWWIITDKSMPADRRRWLPVKYFLPK